VQFWSGSQVGSHMCLGSTVLELNRIYHLELSSGYLCLGRFLFC